jgi:ubiquinone/menaquinone biosynthesis C-methylase UbiE
VESSQTHSLEGGPDVPLSRSQRVWACQLDGGRLTAVDRSPKMIDAAARRNAAYVEAGKAEFLVADLEDMDLGERRFDKIFAFA